MSGAQFDENGLHVNLPGEDCCPLCDAYLEYWVDGKQYSRKIGVEIQGVYDGMLFYQCPFCHGRWHRFPLGDRLRARAEEYVRAGGKAS